MGTPAYQQSQTAINNALSSASNNAVDINALNNQVTQQSLGNAAASNALEQQYNPYLNALRQSAAQSLGQYTTPSATQNNLTAGLMGGFNSAASGPMPASQLFTNAANVAQQQLALGGRLDQETQNQIMRAGASASGQMGGPGGGLGLGRDISARDLGLTSLQLQNQRMQNAANIGSTQQNYGLSAQQAQLQSMLGFGGLANTIGQDQFGRNMTMAQFTQSIEQPQVGLSPSSTAGIAVGNQNMAANASQQAAAIAANQAAGQMQLYGLLSGAGRGSSMAQPSGFGLSQLGGASAGMGGYQLGNTGISAASPGWADQPSYWDTSWTNYNTNPTGMQMPPSASFQSPMDGMPSNWTGLTATNSQGVRTPLT